MGASPVGDVDALPPRPSPPRPLRVLVQATISLVALAAVVWWALRQEAPSFPRTGEAAATLGLALVLYAVVTAARAERWHQICRRAGLVASRADTYRLTTIGYMGNNVLPARSGEMLRAFLLAARAHTRKRHVLGTIVAERTLDAVALGLVFLAVALGLLREVDVPGGSGVVLASALAVVAVAGAGVAFALVARRRNLIPRLREAIRPLSTPTRALASPHGVALLAFSVVLWTVEAGVYLAVGRALGIELDLLDALYVVALTNLFALVPAAPGYVGTFDAAVLFALDSLGASGSEAISYLVLIRFVLFVPITLVGAAFLAGRYGGWSRLRAARLDASR